MSYEWIQPTPVIQAMQGLLAMSRSAFQEPQPHARNGFQEVLQRSPCHQVFQETSFWPAMHKSDDTAL